MWGVWSASQAPSQFSSSGSVPIKRLTESYIFDSFLDASSLSNYIATARTVVASGSHSWTSSESSKSFLKAKASHMRMRLTKLLHSTKMWSCSLARNLQRVNVGGTSVIPWIMVWLSVFLQQLNKPFVCVCASACVCFGSVWFQKQFFNDLSNETCSFVRSETGLESFCKLQEAFACLPRGHRKISEGFEAFLNTYKMSHLCSFTMYDGHPEDFGGTPKDFLPWKHQK